LGGPEKRLHGGVVLVVRHPANARGQKVNGFYAWGELFNNAAVPVSTIAITIAITANAVAVAVAVAITANAVTAPSSIVSAVTIAAVGSSCATGEGARSHQEASSSQTTPHGVQIHSRHQQVGIKKEAISLVCLKRPQDHSENVFWSFKMSNHSLIEKK
jgi:hypothetical protein